MSWVAKYGLKKIWSSYSQHSILVSLRIINIMKNLAIIYHNLSILLDAGLPILRSLDSVAEGLQGRLKQVFIDLRKSVSQGNGISDSMAEYPEIFAEMDVMLVQTAELSGELPKCFKLLSRWYEFSNRMRKRIFSGLLLPLLIFHIAVFIAPLPSVILGQITFARYLTIVGGTLGILYLIIGIMFVIPRYIRKNSSTCYFFDYLTLKIPLLGKAIRELSICRYCMGFNMMYKSGVPIIQCASKAPKLTGNTVISGLFQGGAASTKAGNIISEGFSDKLPSEYIELWRTGEETGGLEKMIDKIAEISGDKAEHLFTEFSKWFPKFVYFLVCIFVIMQIFRFATTGYFMNIP